MENKAPTPWYKRKRYLIPIGLLTLVAISSSGGTTETSISVPAQSSNSAAVIRSIERPVQPISNVLDDETKDSPTDGLSNNNYYTNSSGNKVHSPAYSSSIPTGASAQCRDGTYSFSQSRRGTCSHHGGVRTWY